MMTNPFRRDRVVPPESEFQTSNGWMLAKAEEEHARAKAKLARANWLLVLALLGFVLLGLYDLKR